ncbi:auxin-induced protein 5NG4 [Cryptomeria japonica]|uniref:auxin-induced protein 5NG4 n=1 Tax=Cryptomeria japonica TaxID=3369 RepID=UPI0025ACD616|nr:auxin-induced protein 5NG4 [Cryptomeria japonica]
MADIMRRFVLPERAQLHIAMLALQFGYAGFHIVSRAALNMGVSKIVFPVYRNIIALILLAPFAYFLEKKERPPLTLSFLVQFFLLALLGITANQGFYLLGLYYTSPTFASAIQNSVPALTFIMAAALRLEEVHLRRRDGLAKIVGTIACVGGATIITLYKGPAINHLWQKSLNLGALAEDAAHLSANAGNWTLGCLYMIGNCLAWSGWIVIQAPVLRKYPARLSVTSFTCFFGLIQFLVIACFFERDLDRWQMHSGGELFTILYAGIVASGIAFSVQIWCIDRGGPVFVAVYQPVQTIAVAVMASIILGEEFYTGGIIGAILIIIGLYLVLWGKSEEKRLNLLAKPLLAPEPTQSSSSSSSHLDEEAPRIANKGFTDLTQPLLDGHDLKHNTA